VITISLEQANGAHQEIPERGIRPKSILAPSRPRGRR
jgi:hypothetical protein